MAPKIFITGATGYIGGDALHAIYTAHPDYSYTALVRNSDKGALVAAAYPSIRLVYGTLDSADLIEEEASKADIVIHTADSSDDELSATAIATGLAKGHTAEKPGYWIHISGTGILCWKDMETKEYGLAPHQPGYNDLSGVSALTSLPDSAWHRGIDKLVLSSNSTSVKTAILCPPTIYGPGRGPGNQRSQQVYVLAKKTLEDGQAPIVGTGKTEWDNVHVHDLSDVFVRLVEAAAGERKVEEGEVWGERGYFLVESGTHVWGEVSKWVAEAAVARGYIKTTELKPFTIEKPGQEMTWGLNSKGKAERAKKYLGWEAKGKSLKELIPAIVDGEAEALGLKVGHAKTVTGA